MVSHPFIEQIDHVAVQAEDPKRLFHFFVEDLGLPAAFPYTEYPGYISGSAALGNAFLELMRFGERRELDEDRVNRAQYHILGFMCPRGGLARAIPLLDEYGISHSGMIPFFSREATDDQPDKLWENIYLGGFFGYNLWTRLFFSMSINMDPKPSSMESPFIRNMSLQVMRRAFSNGMVVLTEYFQRHDDQKRVQDRRKLEAVQGGALGVQRLREVAVGAQGDKGEMDRWRRLVATASENDREVFHLGVGPALRIEAASPRGIRRITLDVNSLSRAVSWLRSSAIKINEGNKRVRFSPPGAAGIEIELGESEQSK